jgi:hypothetical protein
MTVFSNKASIYFDFNKPIVTNLTTTSIKEVSNLNTSKFDHSAEITLYPNPSKEILNFKTNNDISVNSIEIYNMSGQLVMNIINAKNSKSVDISRLSQGSYIIKIITNNGVLKNVFVKE